MAQEKTTNEKNAPVHEIRYGRVKAVVFENETENGTRSNVRFSRLYKVEDAWKESVGIFGRDELPLLAKAAEDALTYIYAAAQNEL